MKKVFSLIFSLLFLNAANSQDITLYVKKGSVDLQNQVLKAGVKQIIKKNDVVKVHSGGLVLLNRDNSWVEVPQNQLLSFGELEKLFPPKKTFSGAFFTVTTNQAYSQKKSAGAITRGGQEDKESFSPDDSLYIISDSIRITVGGAAVKLLSDIKLFEKSSGDTIVYSGAYNTHLIKCPAPGEYIWKYKFTRDRKNYSANNYFIVPNQAKRDELENALKEYIAELGYFSEEMKTFLIDEYCFVNKIYTYKNDVKSNTVNLADLEEAMNIINTKLIEKSEKPAMASRGDVADPCEEDLDRLKVVFSQWKNYYKKCCTGQSNAIELANILYEVKQILENGDCIWEDNPEMYVIVLIYMGDLSTFFDEYPCNRKCDCGGCED